MEGLGAHWSVNEGREGLGAHWSVNEGREGLGAHWSVNEGRRTVAKYVREVVFFTLFITL